MMDAVLCVGTGTTVPAGRADLQALEADLCAVAPACRFATALTSAPVRRRLAAQGIQADSVPRALEQLAAAGCRRVAVQPVHLLCGEQYDALRAELQPFAAQFDRLALGEPLLAGVADLQAVAAAVCAAWTEVPGEALLLMGHGSAHFAGVAYPALQAVWTAGGRRDIFLAVVEGWPALADVLPALQKTGYTRVHLAPFLLSAGAHACRDMAGDAPDSWQSRLQAAGLTVRCTLRGLGSLPEIRQLYVQKLRRLLAQEDTAHTAPPCPAAGERT